MKVKVFLSLTVVFGALATVGFAQSVVITRKDVTYKRQKPMHDSKKSFTISYPKIKAATRALSSRIENSISYGKVLGLSLKGELTETQWLESADYDVEYNNDGILSIS